MRVCKRLVGKRKAGGIWGRKTERGQRRGRGSRMTRYRVKPRES